MKNTSLNLRISVNSKICFGKPCIKGTRIPIYLILELLESGYTPERIIDECYPQLTKKDIQAVIHYAAELIKNEDVLVSSTR